MLLEAAVFLNDVHLEREDDDYLEDDDYDVIYLVIPPLSIKIVMKKLRMLKVKVNGGKMTV